MYRGSQQLVSNCQMTAFRVHENRAYLQASDLWTYIDNLTGFEEVVLNRRKKLSSFPTWSRQHVLLLHGFLPWRSTSKMEDQVTCMSILLGLNMRRGAGATPSARMEQFWSLLPEIPQEVIFLDTPRLHTRGFGWAPSTFLQGQQRLWHAATETSATLPAMLIPKGLIICAPARKLGCAIGTPYVSTFEFFDAQDIRYAVMCSRTNQTTIPGGGFRHHSRIDPWSRAPLPYKGQANLYILFREPPSSRHEDGPGRDHEALMVLSKGEDVVASAFVVGTASCRRIDHECSGINNEGSGGGGRLWIDVEKAKFLQRKTTQAGAEGEWALSKIGNDGQHTIYHMGSGPMKSRVWCLE